MWRLVAVGLALSSACGSSAPSPRGPGPDGDVVIKPPPPRPGVPPPADEAGFRKLLVGDVAYGGLWFADPACEAQFGAAGTIKPPAFDAFARCVGELHLHPTGRADAFDDTSVVTDDNGFEIEARVVRGELNFIGFSARSPGWSDFPSITPGALESLRASGDPHANISGEDARRIEWKHGSVHLRLCLAENGQVTVMPGSTMTAAALAAFSPIVRTWTFRPFVAAGKTMAVCAVVGFSHPAAPDPEPERLPQPPHFSKAGHVMFNIGPRELENLRVAGEKFIFPSDSDKTHLDGQRLIGSFKACFDETGHYESGTLLKSTGLLTYDRKIAREIMHWVFRPYVIDGAAIPVCSAFTFIYSQR